MEGELEYKQKDHNTENEFATELAQIKETRNILAKFKNLETQQEVGIDEECATAANMHANTNGNRVTPVSLHAERTETVSHEHTAEHANNLSDSDLSSSEEDREDLLVHVKDRKNESLARFQGLETQTVTHTNRMHDFEKMSPPHMRSITPPPEGQGRYHDDESESSEEEVNIKLIELEEAQSYAHESKKAALQTFKSLENGKSWKQAEDETPVPPPVRSITPPQDFMGYNSDPDDDDAEIDRAELDRLKELEETRALAQESKRAALARFQDMETNSEIDILAPRRTVPSPPPVRSITPPPDFTGISPDSENDDESDETEAEKERELREAQALAHESKRAALEHFRNMQATSNYVSEEDVKTRPQKKWTVNVPYNGRHATVLDDAEIECATGAIDAVLQEDEEGFSNMHEMRQVALERFRSLEQGIGRQTNDVHAPPPVRSITPPRDFNTDDLSIVLSVPEPKEVEEVDARELELNHARELGRVTKNAALQKFRMLEQGRMDQDREESRVAPPPVRSITPPPEGLQLSRASSSDSSDSESGGVDEELKATFAYARETKQSALLKWQEIERGGTGKKSESTHQPPPMRSITPPPQAEEAFQDTESSSEDEEVVHKQEELQHTLGCAHESKTAALQKFQSLERSKNTWENSASRGLPRVRSITPPPEDGRDSGIEDLHLGLELPPDREPVAEEDNEDDERQIQERARESKMSALQMFKTLEGGKNTNVEVDFSKPPAYSSKAMADKNVRVVEKSSVTHNLPAENCDVSMTYTDRMEDEAELSSPSNDLVEESYTYRYSYNDGSDEDYIEVSKELKQVKKAHAVHAAKVALTSPTKSSKSSLSSSEETIQKVRDEIRQVSRDEPRPPSPERKNRRGRQITEEKGEVLREMEHLRETRLTALERFKGMEEQSVPKYEYDDYNTYDCLSRSKSLPSVSTDEWERDVEIISKEH